MDPRKKLLREIHTRAKRYAMFKSTHKNGSIIDPDDFAQEVVLYVLENNRDDPGPLLARYADYLRKQFGRVPRDESRKAAKSAKLRQESTLKYISDDKGNAGAIHPNIEALADNVYLPYFFRKVSLERRLVYVLHHKYEYTLQEIADMVGLSESRICHFVTETQQQIDYNLRILKLRDSRVVKKS